MELDHIAIAARTLEEGTRAVEEVLGISLAPGGRHPLMGTHNRLLSLGPGLYLEVIAIDPEAAKPAHPRWFRLDEFDGPPRLANWVVRVPDLDAALAAAPKGAGRPVALERGDLRWRMGVTETGRLPFDDAFPAFIEWEGEAHPSARLPDVGCRLTRLTVTHPRAEALRAALPLADTRVSIVPGPDAALMAEIATPLGPRLLA
ncbi:VOC family protein [Ostreiculturibacter nitratireducens]|uniref:VOC family protein n=1 Tax=Ostreiculturibacter nitratireducens TaxID=3075226 RepID=UPI0031B5D62A